MDNLLIGICDNSEKERSLLMQYLTLAEATLCAHFEIKTFSTGVELLQKYRPIYNLLFITLPLTDIDADALLSQIRKQDALVHIVLLSESNSYFSLGYEYHANNYFTKPLWYFKLLDEIKDCLYDEKICQRPSLWISNQHGDYKIYLHKLRYIETNDRQLCFHYSNDLLYYHGKIADFEQQLAKNGFFRCNNSYLVNLNYIQKIAKEFNRYALHLVTGEKVPLSRNKKNLLFAKIREFRS